MHLALVTKAEFIRKQIGFNLLSIYCTTWQMMILQQTENQVSLKCCASEKGIIDWRGHDLFGVSVVKPLIIRDLFI